MGADRLKEVGLERRNAQPISNLAMPWPPTLWAPRAANSPDVQTLYSRSSFVRCFLAAAAAAVFFFSLSLSSIYIIHSILIATSWRAAFRLGIVIMQTWRDGVEELFEYARWSGKVIFAASSKVIAPMRC